MVLIWPLPCEGRPACTFLLTGLGLRGFSSGQKEGNFPDTGEANMPQQEREWSPLHSASSSWPFHVINLKSTYWASLGFQLHISDCCTYQTWKLREQLLQNTGYYSILFPPQASSTILSPCLPYHYFDWSSPFLPRQHQSFPLPLILLPCLCYLHLLIIV